MVTSAPDAPAAPLPVARYKDLCIDTDASDRLGRFWAAVLGLAFEGDDEPGGAGALGGPTPSHRVWMNVVPEAKTVKHRAHLDVVCASIDDLTALGATVLEPQSGDRGWTVLADPEGGEFCAFVRDAGEVPEQRLKDLVIDCANPRELATWWGGVFGVAVDGRPDKDWWWLDAIPGWPYESWDFVPVPEPKSAKNRIHWDVMVDAVDDMVAAGATLLRGPTDEDSWTVMADPEGNEFCAFVRSSGVEGPTQ